VRYEGRAQLGDDDGAIEVVVRIPDVEQPDWFAVVLDATELPRGELAVTLLDGGLYNAWRGSAVVNQSTDGRLRLMGHIALTPPVGA
jgi:hypothetical protein